MITFMIAKIFEVIVTLEVVALSAFADWWEKHNIGGILSGIISRIWMWITSHKSLLAGALFFYVALGSLRDGLLLAALFMALLAYVVSPFGNGLFGAWAKNNILRIAVTMGLFLLTGVFV